MRSGRRVGNWLSSSKSGYYRLTALRIVIFSILLIETVPESMARTEKPVQHHKTPFGAT